MISGVTSGFSSSPVTGGFSVPGGSIGGAQTPPSNDPASENGGDSFASVLKDTLVHKPSESQMAADKLTEQFAAGADIDPHQMSIASAQAGIEIQMATRVISQAVSAVKTLAQMPV